ncbi:MAG: hypothetical protein JXM71_12650 [Spirochaetales bacterium]|nr:hypothetical protein [Spirochaetales bacterium]
MRSSEYIALLFASPLGLGLSGLSLAAALAAWFLVSPFAGIVTGVLALPGLLALATLFGAGPQAAAAELERRTWAKAKGHLAAARKTRDRLSSLRVPDQTIKSLLELVAMRGSSYLAACDSAKTRDPRAEEALADCLDIADLYLKELDGASTERRFGLPDEDPFAAATERAAAALKDRAAIIGKAAQDLSGGCSPADTMEIKESL